MLAAGARLAFARHPQTRQPAGPLRMWPGGLAVGRSLGDADCGPALVPTPAERLWNTSGQKTAKTKMEKAYQRFVLVEKFLQVRWRLLVRRLF